MMNGASMMAGMGWPGLLLVLLLWGGAIVLALWGVSSLFPSGRVRVEADALEILRQRYARGEISREEYLQASETLRQPEAEPLRHAADHPRRS
jgi:putative membrane protein